ncbi:MAG: response regulator transcription factor [Chloroflexota bacterium]
MEKIKLFIVDGEEIFRAGLEKLLESDPGIRVVGMSASTAQALERSSELHPDVVLIDAGLPQEDWTDAIKRLYEMIPSTKVVMLGRLGDRDLLHALKAGAKGYISKHATAECLLKSVRLVYQGEVIISSPMAARMLEEFGSLEEIKEERPDYNLSRREREVMELAAKGATNKEISSRLFIAENTVKVHLHKIMEKLQVRSRHQIADLVSQQKLAAQSDKT